jgi:hypothetical protein
MPIFLLDIDIISGCTVFVNAVGDKLGVIPGRAHSIRSRRSQVKFPVSCDAGKHDSIWQGNSLPEWAKYVKNDFRNNKYLSLMLKLSARHNLIKRTNSFQRAERLVMNPRGNEKSNLNCVSRNFFADCPFRNADTPSFSTVTSFLKRQYRRQRPLENVDVSGMPGKT